MAGEKCRSDEQCTTCTRSDQKGAKCNGAYRIGDFGTKCRVNHIQAFARNFAQRFIGGGYVTVNRGDSHILVKLPGLTNSFDYKCEEDSESFFIGKQFNRVYITYSDGCELTFEFYHCDDGFRGSISFLCLFLLAMMILLDRHI